jgi:hypothetical protein
MSSRANKRAKAAPGPTWSDRLDAAVKAKFEGVECETYYNIFAMRHVTRWWQAGTDDTKLKPALARQVGAFVAGFMAALAEPQS